MVNDIEISESQNLNSAYEVTKMTASSAGVSCTSNGIYLLFSFHAGFFRSQLRGRIVQIELLVTYNQKFVKKILRVSDIFPVSLAVGQTSEKSLARQKCRYLSYISFYYSWLSFTVASRILQHVYHAPQSKYKCTLETLLLDVFIVKHRTTIKRLSETDTLI